MDGGECKILLKGPKKLKNLEHFSQFKIIYAVCPILSKDGLNISEGRNREIIGNWTLASELGRI